MVALSVLKIGVFANEENPHLHGYLRGIRDFADEHGGWELFGVGMPCYCEIDDVGEWDGAGSLSIADSRPAYRTKVSGTKPSVVIGGSSSRGYSVEYDPLPGIEVAAKHFLEQGVQHFVSCEGNDEVEETILAEVSRRLGKPFSIVPDWGLDEFCANSHGPVGVFTSDCSQAVKLKRSSSSERMAICSLADDPSCSLASPSISSCGFPAREMGYRAGQMLHQKLMGERVEKRIRVGATSVNVRASSLIHSYSDPVVRDAFRLIQVTVERAPLKVGKLAKMLNVSRSKLIASFQSQVGLPPAEVIRNKRMDAAMRQLHRPGEMVKTVAISMGFSSSQEFARFFKNGTGLTPTEYARNRTEESR